MVYDQIRGYDSQIKKLLKRMEDLEEEIRSIRTQIKDNLTEKNLYSTSSTVSQNTIDVDVDIDVEHDLLSLAQARYKV